MCLRNDGRGPDALRAVSITSDFICHAEGAVLIEWGATRVVCTASVEERVPPFLRGQATGWITSEYGMLPRSTGSRMIREASKGRPSGRTQEIQRLIGRALRSVVDLKALGERTLWLDCDVIQADGGTRTASITGAFVALAIALENLARAGGVTSPPVLDSVAAASVGIVESRPLLDLNYQEDSSAEVDMNVVMTGQGRFVEIQGTAERQTFDRDALDRLLGLARNGIADLTALQMSVLQNRFGGELTAFRSLDLADTVGHEE